LSACGGDESTASNTTTTKKEPSTTTTTRVFSMKEKIRAARFGIIVHGFNDPYTPEGKDQPPAKGHRYVAIDTELRNVYTGPLVIVGALQLVLQDGAGTVYQVRGIGHGKSAIDGRIAPGKARRRTIVYEVPTDARDFSLLFTGAVGKAVANIKLG
jgi:hypothetical protein